LQETNIEISLQEIEEERNNINILTDPEDQPGNRFNLESILKELDEEIMDVERGTDVDIDIEKEADKGVDIRIEIDEADDEREMDEAEDDEREIDETEDEREMDEAEDDEREIEEIGV
jgi:hypothetical protein